MSIRATITILRSVFALIAIVILYIWVFSGQLDWVLLIIQFFICLQVLGLKACLRHRKESVNADRR